jgi:hypothetical protein
MFLSFDNTNTMVYLSLKYRYYQKNKTKMPVGSKPEFLRFRLSLDLSFFGFFKAAIHLDQSPFFICIKETSIPSFSLKRSEISADAPAR